MSKNKDNNVIEKYWEKRSVKYNNLEWVNCNSYIDNLCFVSDLNKEQIVLDVGTGTGVVANNVKKYVKKIIGMDISNAMLKKGEWQDISFINWDIREILFNDGIFDRIFARMVFHHILKNQKKALINCYNYLKKFGKIIIAEALPPSDSKNVAKWFYDMFLYKEKRVKILPSAFKTKLQNCGFKNVEIKEYFMLNFNVNNWIENSGLEPKKISKIMQMHFSAPVEVKKAYNMKINNNQITVNSKYMIITGQKLDG